MQQNPGATLASLDHEPALYIVPSSEERRQDGEQHSNRSGTHEGLVHARHSDADYPSEAATLAPSRSGSDPHAKPVKNSSLNGESGFSTQEGGNTPVDHRPPFRMRRTGTEYIGAEELNALTRQLSQHLSRSMTAGSAVNPESDSFELEAFLKQMLGRVQESGLPTRDLNVVFEDLSVEGVGSGVSFGDTVGSMLMKPLEIIKSLRRKPVKNILQGFTGTVEAGEMLLVLGRPGAGCSTFLKTLANNTKSYSAVKGSVQYSGISPDEMAKHYAGDLAYLPEDDIHLPVLTVDQTLNFAAASRAPAARSRLGSREEYIKTYKTVLLAIFGLRHTVNTKVGGDYVRGVSGGQRKRVSIAEMLTTRAKVACHDNSTRGLDASTSLEYVQSLRTVADLTRVATIVSIYQAAENLYKLFDKVCLIYEGRMIYYGPREAAAEYFRGLGYEPHNRQTTPDFLCSITDPNSRVPIEGFQGYRPQTAEEFAKAFVESDFGKRNAKSVKDAQAQFSSENVEKYRHSAKSEQVSGLAKKTAHKKADKASSPYVISYWQQTKLCMRRRVQLALGDIPSLVIPIIASIIQAIIIGSTFFRITNTTAGYFSRGGVVFFAILFNAFQALAEITTSYTQRPVIVRQRRYAMVHPSCDALAQTIVDLPLKFVVVLLFDIVLYFFTGLSTRLASQFFVFILFTYLVTMTMIAFFRALAASTRAESTATMLGGLGVLVFVIYAGYAIPRPSMKVWFRWLSYAHPIAFGFEALLTNEFRAYLDTPCAQLVPDYAPSPANQVCAIAGGTAGSNTVNGNTYLAVTYGYYWSHTWRNLGIIIGFWIFFLAIQLISTEIQDDVAEKPAVIVYQRGKAPREVTEMMKGKSDEEKANKDAGQLVGEQRTDDAEQEKAANKLESASDVFMFKNINYDVPTKDGMTRLLNNVNGFVAPGKLTALMGESGAGKTTLLNVLAQRVTTGVVTGDMLVNGRPLPQSFQRQTGYCQQQDVHLATQTVREALEFSALLRQPANVPRAEKIAYVDSVIKMLEMEAFENALIGEVGEGLNVEARKRLTIGVELAAKPALLLFADEPTSGLDSQSAWSIVQFLRKLADHGQAILCTIHQPSSELFQVFDRLLLLKKGGKTAYFGDIGPNSSTLIEYFEEHSGKKCGEQDNPAEYILDCVGAGATAKVSEDWGQIWLNSDMRKKADEELAHLEDRYKGKTSQADESPDAGKKYAATLWTQLTVVGHRGFQHYWRDPVFIYSKLLLNIFAGLFIGFSFWMAPDTQQGLQVNLFAVFMAIVLASSLAQQIQPKFIALRALYEVRERPSRMYNFVVQTFTSIIIEMPWNILAGTLFWCCWYFTIGGSPGQRAIYSWVTYAVAFELYWQSFAQAVAAMSPNGMIASIIFSFLFSFVIVFNGVLQPPSQLPYFWRSWMFPLTPFRYLVAGLLADNIGNRALTCTQDEIKFVTPPAGVGTCQDYLGAFVQASTGFITNPQATGVDCGYCQYGNGNEYLTTVQASYDQRWRNFGILWGYIAFNLLVVFLCTWLFRIHSWSRKSKASNPKATKKELPQQTQQQVAKTENKTKDTGAVAVSAFDPQPPGAAREGNTVTSNLEEGRSRG